MTAGNFTLFNIAKLKIVNGTIDLDSHSLKLALTTVTQALDATFAGTSADARYSDLTNEAANGAGYTTGGVAITGNALTRLVGTVTFDANDAAWTALTKTFKYAVLYDNTNSNKDLIGFVDLDTTPGSITITASDYTIQWNASGLETFA